MRITLVSETFFPQLNGVSRTLGQLTAHLRSVGDQVQVVRPCYRSRETPAEIERARSFGDVPVRSVRLPFYPDVVVPVPPFPRVWRAVREFNPDIMHIATEVTLGFAALRRARRMGVPVVSSFHTNFDQYTAHYGMGWGDPLVWRYLRWFHNRTLETYVPSRVAIEALEARGFERLVLWPRGVDSALFRPARPGREAIRAALGLGPGDVLIGHVGRLAPEKNIPYLAEALARVHRERPAARFLVVGDGPERERFQAGLEASGHFAGFRTGDDLADHYSACDLFAFASRTETFGNVVLEAMASGLPVVAVAEGGVRDIVRDGETGLMIDPAAPPEAFARAVLELADDAARRERMARAARAHAEGQSWSAIMGALRDRYVAALEAFRAGAGPSSPSASPRPASPPR